MCAVAWAKFVSRIVEKILSPSPHMCVVTLVSALGEITQREELKQRVQINTPYLLDFVDRILSVWTGSG